MLGSEADTIAAIATPAGVGGVGIIRLSGDRAIAIAAELIGRADAELQDRVLTHGIARSQGERLDEVLVVAMRGPRSFTGEDVAEVHGHGGPVNMARLLRAVLTAGARPATAGEFTRRALANNRLNLVEAEALLEVIEATSERHWRLAQQQLAGELGDTVGQLRRRATDVLAELEAHIDFPEEGLGAVVATRLAGELEELGAAIQRLVDSFELGRVLRDGIDVALIGPTNAGKSSLFNKLVGRERAIVDAAPGTTRDYVEDRIVVDGISVCVIDTAGIRADSTAVERKGIDLGRKRVETADVVVVLHPADQPTPTEAEVAHGQRRLDVTSKADLGVGTGAALQVSAKTGAGVDALRAQLAAVALGDAGRSETRHVITSERQRDLLAQAVASLSRAREALAVQPLEVTAVDVREGTGRLAEVLGEAVGDEVLDSLFSRFCIGK